MKQFLIIGAFLLFAFGANAQTVSQIGYSARGQASYFADNRGGIFTASGERYNMNEFVAAHPYIAFNSYVKVTNLNNGYTVIVRINDRMNAQNRIIDLSKAAAEKIGITGQLVTDVKIEIVRDPSSPIPPKPEVDPVTPSLTEVSGDAMLPVGEPNTASVFPLYHTVKKGENLSLISSIYNVSMSELLKINNMKLSDVLAVGQKLLIKDAPKPVVTPDPVKPTTNTSPSTERLAPKPQTLEEMFGKVGTYTLSGAPVKPVGYGAQVGWYNDISKALELGKRFEGLQFGNIYIQSGWEKGKRAYRVILGAYPNKEDTKGMIEFLNERQYHAFPKEHY